MRVLPLIPLALVCSMGACGGNAAQPDSGFVRPDSGPRVDAGPPPDAGPLPDYPAALRADITALCTCDNTTDYASVSDCVNASVGLPVVDDCMRVAVAADPTEYAVYYACTAGPTITHAACLMASGCAGAARTTCDDAFDTATTNCQNPGSPDYAQAFQTCVQAMIIGTGADTCSDTATASMMIGDGVFTGTTLLAGDHRDGTCSGPPSGPDVSHRWTAPASATYTFDTLGSEFNTVLYLANNCSASAPQVACSDDNIGVGTLSSATLAMTAGQTVQIVVDGYFTASAGQYRVNIH